MTDAGIGKAVVDSAVLRSKPWAEPGVGSDEIHAPKGMIGPEERRCYYWLGKHHFAGEGAIVDAGCFVGASTFCFAAGAAAAGRRSLQGAALVHAYDYFRVVDRYVGDAITRDFRAIEEGESYRDIFDAQLGEYVDMVCAHEGDFLQSKWIGAPIEILFIDIAKTADLCAHAVREFFPCLLPERSVVIHQDYYHCWHPYIHIGMEFLDDEFELIDGHVAHQSRVWRLRRRIPDWKIERVASYDFQPEERLALLERLISKSPELSRPMNEIVRLWQLCLDGDYRRSQREFERLNSLYHFADRRELWAVQALQVRDVITQAIS